MMGDVLAERAERLARHGLHAGKAAARAEGRSRDDVLEAIG